MNTVYLFRTMDDEPTVLVVDDNEAITDLYARHLSDAFDVRSAYGGEQALEAMADDVDAVLLDRNMPDLSGDEVLSELRAEYDTPVAFVSAVEPTMDIVDQPFDIYLQKPVMQDDLLQAVDTLLDRRELDPATREQLAAQGKAELLEETRPRVGLSDHDAFRDLLERAGRAPVMRGEGDPDDE